MKSPSISFLSGLFVLCVLSFFSAGCSRSKETRVERAFSLTEGPATCTLISFAKQAEVEIVFNALDLEKITTNGVEGVMTPEEALKEMVSSKGITFVKDDQSDSYEIILNKMLPR